MPTATATTPTTVDAAALRLAVVRLARRLRQAALPGITLSQLSALATVDRLGPLSLGDLAVAEGVAASTLTRLVAALEEAGLLERAADPADRRVAVVRVTRKGARLLATARHRGTQLLADQVAALAPEEAAALAAAVPVLQRLARDNQ